jgi:GxxExxY protein
MTEDQLAAHVVEAAFEIHRKLGPGLLESVYEVVLAKRLSDKGIHVDRQVTVSIRFEGMVFQEGFRADLIVGGKLIVELKSLEEVHAVSAKQLLTYLRLMDYRLGLLINFGEKYLRDGIKRVVNGLPE